MNIAETESQNSLHSAYYRNIGNFKLSRERNTLGKFPPPDRDKLPDSHLLLGDKEVELHLDCLS